MNLPVNLLQAYSRGCIPPQKKGGAHGPRPQLAVEELQGGIPSGCHGSHGSPTQCAAPPQLFWVFGGWPKAHGTPVWGNTLSRRLGGEYSPPVPLGRSSQTAPPDARGPLEVLVGIVLGELDSSTPRVSKTIEIYPDKKTGVGSLHNP